jgi:hypothetical protein
LDSCLGLIVLIKEDLLDSWYIYNKNLRFSLSSVILIYLSVYRIHLWIIYVCIPVSSFHFSLKTLYFYFYIFSIVIYWPYVPLIKGFLSRRLIFLKIKHNYLFITYHNRFTEFVVWKQS